MTVKSRYQIGLEKLQTTESSVTGMKQELIELQPQVRIAGELTAFRLEKKRRKLENVTSD